MKILNHKSLVYLLLVSSFLNGCSTFGQQSLETTRHYYNEEVKTAAEQELLLNIVRLRYTDTPSSLSVSAIAAQYERSRTLGLTPFFTAAGGDINRSFTSILPQAEMTIADRPTFSLTPLDDQEFTRKLFTPIPLDGIVYLAKTTWPISTVFRLYLENLNWVSNAETASGPTPRAAPVYKDFMRGMQALQTLQDQGRLVFGIKENIEVIGGPLLASAMNSQDMLEAAKSGYEYQQRNDHQWYLVKRTKKPVIRLDPAYIDSDEAVLLRKIFKLKANLEEYPLTQEELSPFPAKYGTEGVDKIDLETRSLLQALYYVSHGIDVPAEHLEKGLARETLDNEGKAFNWNLLTNGLFKVLSSKTLPTMAHVAIQYKGYWYYIAENDIETKSTFSLLMELSRLELTGKSTSPLLTLPVGGSR